MNTWHFFKPLRFSSYESATPQPGCSVRTSRKHAGKIEEVRSGRGLSDVGQTISCFVIALPLVRTKQLHKAGRVTTEWRWFSAGMVCVAVLKEHRHGEMHFEIDYCARCIPSKASFHAWLKPWVHQMSFRLDPLFWRSYRCVPWWYSLAQLKLWMNHEPYSATWKERRYSACGVRKSHLLSPRSPQMSFVSATRGCFSWLPLVKSSHCGEKRSWLDFAGSPRYGCAYVVERHGLSLCDPASVQRCLLEYKPYEGSALSVSYTDPPHALCASKCTMFFFGPVPANGGANSPM